MDLLYLSSCFLAVVDNGMIVAESNSAQMQHPLFGTPAVALMGASNHHNHCNQLRCVVIVKACLGLASAPPDHDHHQQQLQQQQQ